MGSNLQQQAACNCCGGRESNELTSDLNSESRKERKKSKTKKSKSTLSNPTSEQQPAYETKEESKSNKDNLDTSKNYAITVTNAFSLGGVGSAINNITNTAGSKAADAIEYVTPYHVTLSEITSDDEYFAHCSELANKIKSNIITPKPVLHDSDNHDNNWESIQSMAEQCQEPLYNFLQSLVDSIKSFPEYYDDPEEPTEVIKAKLKKHKRAKEKVETNYNGNWLRLVDVCRSSIVHNDFKELYYILLILARYRDNCFGFEIVKIKNRYAQPTDQGWADVTLLIKPVKVNQTVIYGGTKKIDLECTMDEEKVIEAMDMGYNKTLREQSATAENEIGPGTPSYDMVDEYGIRSVSPGSPGSVVVGNGVHKSDLPGHICEVQLIHRDMWDKRKEGLFGHKAYNVTRAADSQAIQMSKHVGGKYGRDFMAKAIDMRGDIIGSVGAMAVSHNREKIYEEYVAPSSSDTDEDEENERIEGP